MCFFCIQLYGNKNIFNRTKSIFLALGLVRSAEEFAMARGRKLWEVNRTWIDRPGRFTDFELTDKQSMWVILCG